MDCNDERPPLRDVEAPLRKRVVKEGAPRATSTSVRHNAQVGQGACFTPRCRAAANPLTPHSPSMLTSLVRLVLSQSITTTTTTAYELEGGGAGVFGSILIDSVLLSHCRSLL